MKAIEQTNQVQPGMVVGARRWPQHGSHPDCWQTPRKGVVLSMQDPLAWQGTAAFCGRVPSAQELQAHLETHSSTSGKNCTDVPVMWDFGRVFWEPASSLRSFEFDYAEWQVERKLAFARHAALKVARAKREAKEVRGYRQSQGTASYVS